MIILEKFRPDDIGKLISWIPSKEFLLQWGGPSYEFPLTKEQILSDLQLMEQEKPKALIYKAVLKETKETIGHIQLRNLDYKNNSAVIGRVLVEDESRRNQGLGRRMVEKLLEIAFNDLKLHRVALGVFDFNSGAIHCYQKAGFQIEGTCREAEKMNNEYWSVILMSILEDEYRIRYKI